jgi:ATP-dependent Zn protease
MISMISSNMIGALQRNNFDEKQIGVVKFFSQAALKRSSKFNINDYAIYVMVHLKDRNALYARRKSQLNDAMVSIEGKLKNHNVDVSRPIQSQIEQMNIITYFLDNLLFTVIFFLCMLSFILIYSLI